MIKKRLTEEKLEQNRVYIVSSFGGQYEDKWEHTIGVFTDYNLALKTAKEECDEYYIDESKLPMTMDEYAEFNYGYPDQPENGFDYNDEQLCEYYNTPIDRDGHTKEEFLEMDRIQSLQYEEFTGCHIESYVLNSVGEDKDRICVYVMKDINGEWHID